MAYSAALGERDARCYDTGRPEGIVAHPLFAVCYEWPLVLALRERAGLQPLDAQVAMAAKNTRPCCIKMLFILELKN